METNKRLYYTDGHDVMITDSGFRVKNSLYQLNGITRHGFSIISPHRTPYAIMMILGAVIFICGAFHLLPSSWMYSAVILKFQVAADSLVMTLGSVVFGLGMLTMLRVREKYAVQIFTAEGEKNVVISQSREYIKQIVDGLNRAFLDLLKTRNRR